MHELLAYRPRSFRNLRPDAVPTLKLPKHNANEKISDRQQRFHLKERTKLINSVLVENNDTNLMKPSDESRPTSSDDCLATVVTNQEVHLGLSQKGVEIGNKLKLLAYHGKKFHNYHVGETQY